MVRRQRRHRALCGRPVRDGRVRAGPPGGAKFVEFEPGRKATLLFADGITQGWELAGSDGKTRLTFVQSGFDVDNPPYPGWAGWLTGLAELRRYHEVPRWRRILRQIEVPGVPAGMLSVDA